MNILKCASAAEFQKCGDILFAAKRNELVMSCSFCQEVFTQLQAFMRHLRIQHNNKLEFLMQAKEVEVYAIEELINQSVVSSVSDIEDGETKWAVEDANCLDEADRKWLDEGVEPYVNQQHDKNLRVLNCENEEDLGLTTSTSIPKALEDCDASHNPMHNINSIKYSELEIENHLDNTLLQGIQNNWNDSDTNESILKRIDCAEKSELKSSKLLIDVNCELRPACSTTEMLRNIASTKKYVNKDEKSSTKFIKTNIQGLENLDDVDCLKNVESNLATNMCRKENKFMGFCNPQHNLIENQNFNAKTYSERMKCYLNTKRPKGQILNFKQNFKKKDINSTKVFLKMKCDDQCNETIFKELEHVAESDNIEIKTTKYECMPKVSKKDFKESGCAPKIKSIEKSPNKRDHISYNLIINNSDNTHDLEIQLTNLCQSLNKSVIVEENNAISENNIPLSQELTKALDDVLEEKDLKILNIQQGGGTKEHGNDDVLNLLETELIEPQELILLEDQRTLDANIQPNANKAVKTLKKERKSGNSYENNALSKYQKTNFKAKTSMTDLIRIQTSLKTTKSLVPTELNSINSVKSVQDSQTLLKRNNAIFLNKKANTTNSHNSPVKAATSKNSMKKSDNVAQIKIPIEDQENCIFAVNIQNIKKEVRSPPSSFVNMHRGDKTPTKREQIFFKQSPKTQEKLESSVKNITPIRDNNTCEKRNIKQNPKTQENFKQQQTLPPACQKMLQQPKASNDILPSIRNVKQKGQILAHKTPRNSNLGYNSYAINRTARKKEVLQRMHKIKKQILQSIEKHECITRINNVKSQPIKRQKKEILLENIQILPNLNKTTIMPLILNTFKKPFENNSAPTTNAVLLESLPDDEKQAKLSAEPSSTVSSIKDDKNLIKKLAKRRPSSPLNNMQAKCQQTSPTKEQAKVEESVSDLERTQLDLSESAVEFLQRNLKANRLNVESLLNEELAVDDSIPNENSVESNSNEAKTKEMSNKEGTGYNNILKDLLEKVDKVLADSPTSEDFGDARDINLLAKLGLKIIKLPAIEAITSLEELDKMSAKAIKFASIYKKWPRVWSTKNSKSPKAKEEVNASFKQLLTETNQSFNLALSIVEIKRLANLINIWYAHIFNNKFIEKRKISDSINRFINIFFYIPKTIKRNYFCEYCPEYFNSEHRYLTHRITHTGALFPYTCQNCSAGFETVKRLNNHKCFCKAVKSDKIYQSDSKVKSTSLKNLLETNNS